MEWIAVAGVAATVETQGMQRVGLVWGCAVAVLFTAGCGSTIRATSGSTAGTDGLGLGRGQPAVSTTGGAASTGALGGASSGLDGLGSQPTNGSVTTRSAAGGRAQQSGTTVPKSVTAKSISVGFIYTTGRQQAAAALGAAGVTSGDELAQWKLLIAEVNKTGGLGGRTINPVFYGQSSNSTQTIATSEQAACTKFTQDYHVSAAVSSFEYTSTFMTCMENKGIPTFYSLETLNDSVELANSSHHFEAANLALDRQGVALGSNLVSQGYFKGTVPAVNGIITYDLPAYVRAANVLVSTLKASGVAVRDVRKIPFANTSSDTGRIASSISSAELAFASEGINHVMIFDLNGLLSLLFMTNAESQRYHPRYGVTSQSSGSHLADLLKGNANAQLKDAMGVGWLPILDLKADDYPATTSSAERRRCRNIMLKGGQSQGLSSVGAELVALGQCDDIFMLQKAFGQVSAAVTGNAIKSALEGLGSSFRPAGTFTTTLSSRRHDGVAKIRNMAYLTTCTCFRYTGGTISVG